MTQSALNARLTLAQDTWTEVSEINCTFVNHGQRRVEILGASALPAVTDRGIEYEPGEGQTVSFDTLALFPGASGTLKMYAISRSVPGSVFVSRAAVA